MSNSNLFNKKEKPATKPASEEKTASAFSFKSKKSAPEPTSEPVAEPVAKSTAFSFQKKNNPAPKQTTVADEVANLLGEEPAKEQLTPEVEIVPAVDTAIESVEPTEPIEGEVISVLEAPAEFAHSAQPDGYNNPVLAKIRESLALVKDNIDDEEIVGDAIYNLMQQMRDDPSLADMLEPEDYGIMARGLRESYHVVVTVKETKAKSKTNKALKVDEVTALLGEITI